MEDEQEITEKVVERIVESRRIPLKVKRIRYRLLANEKGFASQSTSRINGLLYVIIVKTGDHRAAIRIVPENSTMSILELPDMQGERWFPVRMQAHAGTPNVMSSEPGEWIHGKYVKIPLDDVLHLEVQTNPEALVEIEFRYT